MKFAGAKQMSPEKILIIEDDSISSKMMMRILEDNNFEPFLMTGHEIDEDTLQRSNFFAAVVDMKLADPGFEEISTLINKYEIPLILFAAKEYSSALRDKVANKKILDFVQKKDAASLGQIISILSRLRKNSLMKVLLVDDSKFALTLAASILKTANFEVFTASDGQEAVEILNSTPDISIVLTDYDMPVLNGLDLLKKIRERFDRNSMAVIAVSQMTAQTNITTFLRNGANDYVMKPYTNDELYCRVVNSAELVESYREINRINQNMNYLMGMASHDIRGPLGSISELCSYLAENPDEYGKDSYKNTLNIIAETSEHILSMVNSLLDISTIDHKDFVLKKSDTSLTELIRQRIDQIFLKSVQTKNIRIIYEPVQEVSAGIDKTRIIQVLDNLISNAVKFTPAGGEIIIDVKKSGNDVYFSIKDSGPGLTKKDMDQVFKEFKKLSAAPTSGENSVGLGLSICKRIITLHNGEIGARTRPEGGADFYFNLPLKG